MAVPTAADDRVHGKIIKRYEFRNYTRIFVVPLDASKAELPKKRDNAHKPVMNVLARSTGIFIEGLKYWLTSDIANRIEIRDAPGQVAGAIVLRCRIDNIDPGLRWARAWGTAGATEVVISGDFVDAKTGDLLYTFTHTHRSSGGGDRSGGRYEALLENDVREIGKAVAQTLRAYENGPPPAPWND